MHIFTRPEHTTTTTAISTDTKHPAVHSSPITTDSSTLRSSSPPLHNFHTHPSASCNSKSATLLKWTRVILALLPVAMGLATVGCAAHVLARYNGTVFGGEWYLPLWPVNVDVRPTVAAAVTGAIVALGNLVYLVVGAVSKTHSHVSTPNVIFAFISIVGVVVSLFAVIYCHVVTFIVDADTRYTLLTFTCGLYDNARSFTSSGSTVGLLSSASGSEGLLLPSGFGRLCKESQVARWMMVALFVIEVVGLGVAGVGMLRDKKMARASRERDMSTGTGFHGGRDEKSAFA